ncbi:glycosyltransferase [Caldivirga maquilingensis]|uniref:glycosyltransferase n=1 Tax=Caldivirga maquilingensis TaxID=76887 RepID=UPI003083F3DF
MFICIIHLSSAPPLAYVFLNFHNCDHNPDASLLSRTFSTLTGFVDVIIMVDNASSNRDFLIRLCGSYGNCDFLEVGFNSGVAHALRIGVKYAVERYNPQWLLFLDDDSTPLRDAMPTLIKILRKMPNQVGAVRISPGSGDCRIYDDRYGMFSGTFIRSSVALRACCRDDFFLDQADLDMYFRVRELGYRTLFVNCKLLDHRLGVKAWIPVISHRYGGPVDYEPPWRLYYIARNSTVLLLEGKIDSITYLLQLINWGLKGILRDRGKAIKAVSLGIMHGLLKELGYLTQRNLKKYTLSTGYGLVKEGQGFAA